MLWNCHWAFCVFYFYVNCLEEVFLSVSLVWHQSVRLSCEIELWDWAVSCEINLWYHSVKPFCEINQWSFSEIILAGLIYEILMWNYHMRSSWPNICTPPINIRINTRINRLLCHSTNYLPPPPDRHMYTYPLLSTVCRHWLVAKTRVTLLLRWPIISTSMTSY